MSLALQNEVETAAHALHVSGHEAHRLALRIGLEHLRLVEYDLEGVIIRAAQARINQS